MSANPSSPATARVYVYDKDTKQESKYTVTPSPKGFRITGIDRNTVTVRLDTAVLTVQTEDEKPVIVGLYDYNGLAFAIGRGLLRDRVKTRFGRAEGEHEHVSVNLEMWAINGTRRAIGTRVHAQWRRLIDVADPRVRGVVKALAVLGSHTKWSIAWEPALYAPAHASLVDDIIRYRACAMACQAIEGTIEAVVESRLRASDAYAVISEAMGPTWTVSLQSRCARSTIKDDSAVALSFLHDWRQAYAHHGVLTAGMRATIEMMPGRVSIRALSDLRQGPTTRQLRTRLEFLAQAHANNLCQAWGIPTGYIEALRTASDAELRRAHRAYKKAHNDMSTLARWACVTNFLNEIQGLWGPADDASTPLAAVAARAIPPTKNTDERSPNPIAKPTLGRQARILAAIIGNDDLAAWPEMWEERYAFLRKDIASLPAASIAAANAVSLVEGRAQDRLATHPAIKGLVASCGANASLSIFPGYTSNTIGIDIIPGVSCSVSAAWADDTSSVVRGHVLDALCAWETLYAHGANQVASRSVRRTLGALCDDVPVRGVPLLRLYPLPRPVLDPIEQVLVFAYLERKGRYNAVVSEDLDRVFYFATRADVALAMTRYATHARDDVAMEPTKVDDVRRLVDLLCDDPESIGHRGKLPALAELSAVWHRTLDGQRRQRDSLQAHLSDDTKVALPPKPLPDDPQVTFLPTVGAIRQEGSTHHMGHCIGSMAFEAMRGACFLFHTEHQASGTRASTQVTWQGRAAQSYGPKNTVNAASKWATDYLTAWVASGDGWTPVAPRFENIGYSTDAGVANDFGDDLPF